MKPLIRLFFGKKSLLWILIVIGSNEEAPPRSGLLIKPVQLRAYETIVLCEYVSRGRIPFSWYTILPSMFSSYNPTLNSCKISLAYYHESRRAVMKKEVQYVSDRDEGESQH